MFLLDPQTDKENLRGRGIFYATPNTTQTHVQGKNMTKKQHASVEVVCLI